MNLRNPNTIDAIGVHKETGELVLTIIDSLEWKGLGDDHLLLLQEKVNAYFQFIETGQLAQTYPDLKGRPLRIEIVLAHQPDVLGRQFVDSARAKAEQLGVLLNAVCLPARVE